MPRPPTFRRASPADAARLAAEVAGGMATYASFAPDWTPPDAAEELRLLEELLADDAVWCLLAEADEGVVGQVTVMPAARSARPLDDPSLGHLRNLFVRPSHWGGGLAALLQAAAVGEARDRGLAELRLFTPARHARARRFYEREGWRQHGPERFDDGPGLVIVEYRRTTAQ